MLAVQFISVTIFTVLWLLSGEPYIYNKWLVLLNLENMELYVDFIFDEITAVYLMVGAFIAFLITTYSRNYLHREPGFKRFFTTILFFYLGYNVIVLSGNLTTIFIGWEIVGISSFLLVAFYRNRYIPVKNAVKIFSIYRLGDVVLILAMWLSHQMWHSNVSLYNYEDQVSVIEIIQHHPWISTGFVFCIFIVSAIKSAQFPFSAWLPRAMEGPTPSSAIFYSSLAVHLGILVLLRTYPFWINVEGMKEVIIILGSFSFLFSSIVAVIQPSIKGQIAYTAIAQIGIMAIEVALGWHLLALIHFASHAMLRSYQLLISPSIVAYAIRNQFFEFKKVKPPRLPRILRNSLNSIYILSLNEWYLDRFMYYLVWGPFKRMGQLLQRIPVGWVKWSSLILVVTIPAISISARKGWISLDLNWASPTIMGLALLFILRTFSERDRLLYAWYKIACFHIFIMSSFILNGISFYHLTFYFIGIVASYFLGHFTMNTIRKKEQYISLSGYQGHCYEYPMTEFWFFVSCLGLMGFPITSAFIGIDLLMNNVRNDQFVLLILLLICLLVNGLTMIRMYTRIFLGPHVKTYHTQARKST